MKRNDLTGKKFGRLTAVRHIGVVNNVSRWSCHCDCGRTHSASANNLKTMQCTSCGCSRKRHGHLSGGVKSRTYGIWTSMKQRCHNKNNDFYSYYGGRGIKVCKRWMKFDNFLEDMGETPPKLTLERIDNSKGYHPSNCRWATRSEQCRNTKQNKFVTFNGITMCAKDWATKIGIASGSMTLRMRRSKDPAIILRPKKNFTFHKKAKPL